MVTRRRGSSGRRKSAIIARSQTTSKLYHEPKTKTPKRKKLESEKNTMADQNDNEALEFRSYTDDAWYSVRLLAEGGSGDVLRIKYCGFPDSQDNVFYASDFRDFKHLSDFASRFRPVSVQLQDSECSKVARDLLVCASHDFRPDDIRFYDALVEGVDRSEHSFANGEEECSCTFILSWLHGPNAGNINAENIGQICRVQFTEEVVPIVASFVKIAKEKIAIISCNSNLISDGVVAAGNSANDHGETPRLKIGHKLSFSHHIKQEAKHIKWSLSDSLSSKWTMGYPCEKTGQDIDIGGVGDYYLIFVENLETDLTPLAIMEFIRTKVLVASQAFIFPSLSSEFCTRGNILLDSKRNFEKLCNFLENPDQIIVSSRGRPWVITEKLPVSDALRASIKTFLHIPQARDNARSEGLKVVRSGTDEFRFAKQLSDLYKEFSNHQQRLQKRLIVEEGKIWQQHNAKRRFTS